MPKKIRLSIDLGKYTRKNFTYYGAPCYDVSFMGCNFSLWRESVKGKKYSLSNNNRIVSGYFETVFTGKLEDCKKLLIEDITELFKSDLPTLQVEITWTLPTT